MTGKPMPLYSRILLWIFGFTVTTLVAAQQCGRYSCHGDVGNLAAGRRILASSTCGQNAGEEFCEAGPQDCSPPVCRRCKAGKRGHEHPSSFMTDSTYLHSHTWWQAANNEQEVTLQFNLETTFYFTHLIMQFRSPRPGAMTLEKSSDFGRTWKVYQRYAQNCLEVFGMLDDVDVDEALCTSRYSDPLPCTKGEVTYRVLNPLSPIDDPYSAEARHLLKITNLRIRMWLPQTCPHCVNASRTTEYSSRRDQVDLDITPKNLAPFAIYDLIVRGTCFCNGHADTCVPLHDDGSDPVDNEQDVVHGKCICEHNTAGDHCDECLPLYNDAPWRPGNGDTGAANPCKRCSCHGHANNCTFDHELWSASGNVSGGVCQGCQHNTEGRNCDGCKAGFFRRMDSVLSDQDVCQECLCDPVGTQGEADSVTGRLPCDYYTGKCQCKPGVGGRRCGSCLAGHWGFSSSGCTECLCEHCDSISGACELRFVTDEIIYPIYNYPYLDEQDREWSVKPNYPDEDRMASSYRDSVVVRRYEDENEARAHSSAYNWKNPNACDCKQREIDVTASFCRRKYDYAVRVRIKGAHDMMTYTFLSVAVRRVIKRNSVEIRRGKATLYPESWTIMGCTCPVLKPNNEYLVIGHEDPITGRLMVNVESVVKEWYTSGKHMLRNVKRLFRKCDQLNNKIELRR